MELGEQLHDEEAYKTLDSLGPDILRLLDDFDALEDVPGGLVGASAALDAALDTPALSLGLPHSNTPSPPDGGPLPPAPAGPRSPPQSAFAEAGQSADTEGAAAASALRKALARSSLAASPSVSGGGVPPGTKAARMQGIRRSRTSFAAPASPPEGSASAGVGAGGGALRRVLSGSDLATATGAAPAPAGSGGTAGGGPLSAATTVKMETLRLDRDGGNCAGGRPGSGRRLKRRGSGRSSCDETDAAAEAAAVAGAGEPSNNSGQNSSEAAPGEEAGQLRALLANQKASFEVRPGPPPGAPAALSPLRRCLEAGSSAYLCEAGELAAAAAAPCERGVRPLARARSASLPAPQQRCLPPVPSRPRC